MILATTMKNTKPTMLYAVAYYVAATIIGACAGAVAGVGIAGMLLRPEEAVVLYAGVGYGFPVGAIVGLTLGIVAMVRRSRIKT
jgi:hypothetical protein